ncbi:putative cell division protein kinase (Ctk1) [Aspergillus saccharolyticus JOP 1030-1]|uniref:cyclin-dependent kinase n=1 Tax=Aspergillus saccharolyticus JOP 1030-1 TaxID=1450539 RepID=A0A318ZL76_9EURO|nr:cell division protein kinase [Aspergillus saccharolyticus JOP 1030-1]PYH48361.1 cell division protein kinase [Aspergillus saccharolyticus JOP 1030-1]
MAVSDWKRTLGFSERLTAIQSLTTAFQRASSSAAFTEAQSQARRCENGAYDKASSRDEYDALCQEAIDAAEAIYSVDLVDNSSAELRAEPNDLDSGHGEVIGPYQSCVHHFDGLHSTVYKSRCADSAVVALKVLIPHMLTAPHSAIREVQLLRDAAHAHVIHLIETLKLDGGRLVLVFPFMKHDFEQLLRRGALTAAQTRSHLRDMFRAIAHIHGLGIIHRDIKPSNILMDSPDGPAYLADFGIAWKKGIKDAEPADKKITDVGTTCYRSPELLFGFKGYGNALDLWAAGCVVAESLSVGHHQLFDSGPVGSDLSLIQSIFVTLGTPDETTWPETKILPDWGKIEFKKYPAKQWDEILKGASSKGRDLVSKLVRFESSERLSAEKALNHPYFSNI